MTQGLDAKLNLQRYKAICTVCTLLLSSLVITVDAYAEAPVVDESENFALFEKPNPKYQSQQLAQSEEEAPLAHEEYGQDNQGVSSDDPAALLSKIQNLQQDIQELRGQLEVQANQIKKIEEQQIAFYKDIDARLGTLAPSSNHPVEEMMPSAAKETIPQKSQQEAVSSGQPKMTTNAQNTMPHSAMASASVTPLIATNEHVSYQNAYDLIATKQYDEALPAMQNFVQQFPDGGYTANAHYWLGELHMVKKNYPEAIAQFKLVLDKFPKSNKASASLLKMGYAYAAAGEKAEAKQQLQAVIKNYPDSHAAQLALAKLEAIGHP